MVRARRHVWNYAYWLTGAAGLALLGGLVVAVFIESWGETVLRPTSTQTQIITCCSRLTCSGLPGARAGWLSGLCWRALAFLLLDGHLAAADEAVNAKLNQESRRSSQRREMTDVRHLHFGEPVPVNALADFSSEQARQEQAVFLGKDEQGKPVLVPRDTAQDQHSDPRPARERQERDGHQRAHLRTISGTRCTSTPGGDAWAPHVFRAHCPTSPCWICGRGNRRS